MNHTAKINKDANMSKFTNTDLTILIAFGFVCGIFAGAFSDSFNFFPFTHFTSFFSVFAISFFAFVSFGFCFVSGWRLAVASQFRFGKRA